ncbi:hypothetical protein HDU93_005564 [Gonapodya sp. JEL0774]|nr:hypothetical protein HDU93_005564 [Gonapodya sp. JEL0774]
MLSDSSLSFPDIFVEIFRVDDLPDDLREWCFQLTKSNMKELYNATKHEDWIWPDTPAGDDKKRQQMGSADMRYIVAFVHPTSEEASELGMAGMTADQQTAKSKPVAFVSFEFTTEETESSKMEAVVYCYELQIDASARKIGLGRYLMSLLDTLALTCGFERVMLTVIKTNKEALAFYKSIGFTYDLISPSQCLPKHKAKKIAHEILTRRSARDHAWPLVLLATYFMCGAGNRPLVNKETTPCNAPEARYGHAYCIYENKLYIVGGRLWSDNGQYANDLGAFAFDCQKETWMFEKGEGDVPKPKSNGALVAHYTGIYYFGGSAHRHNKAPASLHHYNPQTRVWRELAGPESQIPSKYHVGVIEEPGIAAYGPYLFAFGGWVDEHKQSDYLFCFDTRTQKWSVPEILNITVNIVDEEYTNPYIDLGSPEAWEGGILMMKKEMPGPRSAHGFEYCPVGGHIILYGGEKTRSPSGRTGHGTYYSDVWALEIVSEITTLAGSSAVTKSFESDMEAFMLSEPVKVLWRPV